MLKDCFENNGIECALSPSGDGYRSALGMSLGKFLIYVLYSKLDEAKEIVQFFRHDRTDEFKEDLINFRIFFQNILVNFNKKVRFLLEKR